MNEPNYKQFEYDIAAVINKHSRENMSNTPDFILALFLERVLEAFEITSMDREKWYGVELNISSIDKIKAQGEQIQTLLKEREELRSQLKSFTNGVELKVSREQSSPSEALFGFISWLTSRKGVIVLSTHNECTEIIELMMKWIRANDLPELRPGWEKYFTTPEE